ncbi:MAG TPA: papain-like cysteine protease family protein, partial [Bryobacteraceae bacterium]|nr:papain-like cysteine protease family protein [Bryobacteraceae bacterium]
LASEVLGESCCSPDGVPDKCNEVNRLEAALDKVHRLESGPDDGGLAFSDIRKLIDKKIPICARIQWPNGEGHFVVISGYRWTKDKKEFVEISDSWHEDSIIPFDEFKQAYQGAGRPDGGGIWSHTYRVKS